MVGAASKDGLELRRYEYQCLTQPTLFLAASLRHADTNIRYGASTRKCNAQRRGCKRGTYLGYLCMKLVMPAAMIVLQTVKEVLLSSLVCKSTSISFSVEHHHLGWRSATYPRVASTTVGSQRQVWSLCQLDTAAMASTIDLRSSGTLALVGTVIAELDLPRSWSAS